MTAGSVARRPITAPRDTARGKMGGHRLPAKESDTRGYARKRHPQTDTAQHDFALNEIRSGPGQTRVACAVRKPSPEVRGNNGGTNGSTRRCGSWGRHGSSGERPGDPQEHPGPDPANARTRTVAGQPAACQGGRPGRAYARVPHRIPHRTAARCTDRHQAHPGRRQRDRHPPPGSRRFAAGHSSERDQTRPDMMNFRKIAAASKGRLLLRYFTEDTPEPIHPPTLDAAGRQLEEGGRLTAYYTGRDIRATWRPDMPAILARTIGIDPHAMPRDAEMSRLFEGRRADNGEAWSHHKRKLSGFDLVFSPHKSISLAAEFAATPAESAALWNAVDRASDRAMRYVAQTLGWARKGAGGEDGADPGAVGWISFRHHTARPTLPLQDGRGGQTYIFDAPVAGDPHMHVHNFLMNLVVTAEGRVGSLDTRALTEARVKEFGAYFQAVLADELRRLGIQVDYDANEQAIVVTAIPEDVNRAFSKRDKQILHKAKRFAESQGLDWDDLSIDKKLDIVEEASAEGRLGKMKSDEKRIWREQAASLGWQHQTV